MNRDQIIKALTDKLLKDLEREEMAIELHEAIAGVLKEKFQGKKITRRLVTLLEPIVSGVLPGSHVSYHEIAGMLNIQVWGGTLKHDDTFRFFIGYDSQDLASYDSAVFEERDACHGKAARKRCAERAELLAGTKVLEVIADRVVKVQALQAEIAKLTDVDAVADVIRYDVQKLLKGEG